MHYQSTLTKDTQLALLRIWGFEDGELLDATAFGDIFIRHNTAIIYISLTDGEINNVSELVEEFGLPPVSLDLGDEWYQLSAQNQLKDIGLKLEINECFGFTKPIFESGEYSPDNIQVFSIIEYHQALAKTIAKS